jgi:hypothetical protein
MFAYALCLGCMALNPVQRPTGSKLVDSLSWQYDPRSNDFSAQVPLVSDDIITILDKELPSNIGYREGSMSDGSSEFTYYTSTWELSFSTSKAPNTSLKFKNL